MRRYHKTSSLSSYQWNKKYNEYKHAFEFNKKRTDDIEAQMITKTEFKRVYRDQIGIKADRRAREIANQQFFNISQKLASATRKKFQEIDSDLNISTTELRTMTTAEIASMYGDMGYNLDQIYWEQRNSGKSPEEARHYVSMNYFGSL